VHAATHFILLLLLGGLQYDLWLGKNGLSDYRELSTAIERQQQDNLVLRIATV
jgi:cell division protein FtsB